MNPPVVALRSYRKKKRLSQEDVAAKLGVSRRLVGMWETGERGLTANWAVAIEGMLGINRILLRPDLFRRRA